MYLSTIEKSFIRDYPGLVSYYFGNLMSQYVKPAFNSEFYFVDSVANDNDSNANGRVPTRPLGSINTALTYIQQRRASQGTKAVNENHIFVGAQHVETVSAASAVTGSGGAADIAGVILNNPGTHLHFMGVGAQRGVVKLQGVVGANVVVDAADCGIHGMVLQPNIDALTLALSITSNAKRCHINDLNGYLGSSISDEFDAGDWPVNWLSVDAAADAFIIEGTSMANSKTMPLRTPFYDAYYGHHKWNYIQHFIAGAEAGYAGKDVGLYEVMRVTGMIRSTFLGFIQTSITGTPTLTLENAAGTNILPNPNSLAAGVVWMDATPAAMDDVTLLPQKLVINSDIAYEVATNAITGGLMRLEMAWTQGPLQCFAQPGNLAAPA